MLASCSLLFLSGPSWADPATFSATFAPSSVRPGETVTVWVDVALSDDWHIYSTTTPPGGPIPTVVRLESNDSFEPVGPVIQPEPVKEHDPNFDMMVEYYGREVRFGVRARVVDPTEPGRAALSGNIRYMLCNATSCLPPDTAPFSVDIDIVPGAPRDAYVTDLVPPSQKSESSPPARDLDGVGSIDDVQYAVETGLGAFLYLSFTMGFLALLTPCVFPMVPITISFFTKQDRTSRTVSVAKSAFYCAGIMVTFTGLGVLLATTMGASGASRFAADPWVNLFITALFIGFALSLFGLFEIRLPSGLLSRLSGAQGAGYGAILLMGFTFSLTSFTCTAPFVGTLLVLTSQGTWSWPILGMLAFSAAFSLPFFFLSLFPQGLGALPRSGGWLNSVKVVMGFLELAAALKFLSNVDLVWNWGIISREVFLAIWVAIFLTCGIYLLGKVRLPHDTPLDSIGPTRLLATVGCFAFCLYLFTGLYGAPLGELEAFFPPYGSRGDVVALKTGHESLKWESDFEAARTKSTETGRPLLIDFTGYACTNCRWMEANMFPLPEVQDLMKQFVRVQLYTDGQGERYERNRNLQEDRFGTVALPFYAILAPGGGTLARFSGLTRDAEVFVRFLGKGLFRPHPGVPVGAARPVSSGDTSDGDLVNISIYR
jgi:thiol:disulfide interchange protein